MKVQKRQEVPPVHMTIVLDDGSFVTLCGNFGRFTEKYNEVPDGEPVTCKTCLEWLRVNNLTERG